MGEMRKLWALVKRHTKVYFKDKMLFFVSMITPLILVVLFLTFLGSIYRDAVTGSLPDGVTVSNRLINAFTGSWLFSSILSVSCVTVAFCSNVMVNDKLNRTVDDFHITPAKRSTLGISYFLANFCTTFLVCLVAFAVGIIYLAIVGWYLSFGDIVMILLVLVLNTLFGTLLASIVGMFINTQGALSGICTLVSSLYGFISGAYMPIAQFAAPMRTVIGLLPGTYSTVLLRHYFLRGATNALGDYLPAEGLRALERSFDGRIVMFGGEVPLWAMFLIISLTVLALLGVYLALAYAQGRRLRSPKLVKSQKKSL